MLFNRKKAVLDAEPLVEFVTDVVALPETYPIVPARQVLPQWFKDSKPYVERPTVVRPPRPHDPNPEPQVDPTLPKSVTNTNSTIRHCPGVIDVLRSGYLLRAWTDIEITTPARASDEPDASFRAMTSMAANESGGRVSSFEAEMNQLLPVWENEYKFALKFDSPWLCKTPPGWSMLFMPIPYAEKTPFRVVPGIVDTDEFHVVNVLAMWDHAGSYLIEAGTPLCWLLPVRRDGFNMPFEMKLDKDRYAFLRARGKGGIGMSSGRMIPHSYVRERMKRRKGAPEQ